ncbi:phosphotransferase system HPr (HPr) family [Desulfonatronum thiosulfatophilum]|uniref:Phosphotransferase system HPr (HPr) family n=1 Tax=Desulfonatronum thiosulfatophilum TaxID=617002 RepID=A0A1G6E4J4_9BACT|nr:HPr family phosphocarrier protein [Desulfonatronum thiosulfatophilum]SDB52311.1 phosphotransferase system HPr (HPr) family [Desulfonatronum thiosulfatophilum]
MIVRQVTIHDPYGLHARPAAVLARKAKSFDADISLCVENKKADAKSILDILGLAVGPGMVVNIEASGRDAGMALDEICDLIGNGMCEEKEQLSSQRRFSESHVFRNTVHAAEEFVKSEVFHVHNYLRNSVRVQPDKTMENFAR